MSTDKMFKIGLIDLDTSHPVCWVPIIKTYEDMKVVAVYDSGEVNPRSYVDAFARTNEIEKVVDNPEEMVPLIDAVIIFSANWDVHIDRAEPFIKAGKPVLIDKPIVGKLSEINRLIELHQKYPDVPIMGGSSLRFASEIVELKKQKVEFGAISFGFASGRGDFFSYGIHTIEMFQGFFGGGVQSVKYLGERKDLSYEVPGNERGLVFEAVYTDGTIVIYQLCAPSSEWFFAITTEKGVKTVVPDQSKLFPPIIEKFHEMIITKKPPVPLSELLECVKVQLAGKLSRETNQIVYLDRLEYDNGFDGKAYAYQYRQGKWKGKY